VFEFIVKGGDIMYVILGLSVIALGLIIERIHAFVTLRTEPGLLFKTLDDYADGNAFDDAIAYCRGQSALIAQLAADLLENRHRGLPVLRKLAANQLDLLYQPMLQKRMSFLATIAKVAPMLGLFGTVWGMIGAFEKISGQAQANPTELASDIGVALNTTFGGLAVAIPILFALTFLRARVRRIEIDLENCSLHVQDLIERTTPRT